MFGVNFTSGCLARFPAESRMMRYSACVAFDPHYRVAYCLHGGAAPASATLQLQS